MLGATIKVLGATIKDCPYMPIFWFQSKGVTAIFGFLGIQTFRFGLIGIQTFRFGLESKPSDLDWNPNLQIWIGIQTFRFGLIGLQGFRFGLIGIQTFRFGGTSLESKPSDLEGLHWNPNLQTLII